MFCVFRPLFRVSVLCGDICKVSPGCFPDCFRKWRVGVPVRKRERTCSVGWGMSVKSLNRMVGVSGSDSEFGLYGACYVDDVSAGVG